MTIEHPVFKIGMLADDVLMIEKKSGRRRAAKNTIEGEDEKGLIVRWHLQDCTLVLGRDKNPGPYVIRDILEPIDVDKRLMNAKQAGLSDDILSKLASASEIK